MFLAQSASSAFALFFALCIGHALADYPLQGDFLAKGKNRFQPLPGVPWYWCLAAHAAIHAGFVWLLTGYAELAAMEFIAHCLIDDSKCEGTFGFDADQILHILCKVGWVLLAFYRST